MFACIRCICFEIRGDNIVTITKKSRNYVAASTVPVTVIRRTIIQADVCLTCGKLIFFKGDLVANDYLEICVIHGVPLFFLFPPFPFDFPDVVGSQKHPFALD